MNADKLVWSVEPFLETMPVEMSAEGEEGEPANASRQAIDNRLAMGDIWAWCRVRVRCCLPGCLYLPGEATVRCGTFPSQEEFMAGDTYQALREAALSDLERKIEAVASAAKGAT